MRWTCEASPPTHRRHLCRGCRQGGFPSLLPGPHEARLRGHGPQQPAPARVQLHLLAVMSRVFGEDFTPFLPHVVPRLIHSCQQSEHDPVPGASGDGTVNGIGIPGLNAGGDDDDDDGFVDIDELNDAFLNVNSAIAIEKEVAADLVGRDLCTHQVGLPALHPGVGRAAGDPARALLPGHPQERRLCALYVHQHAQRAEQPAAVAGWRAGQGAAQRRRAEARQRRHPCRHGDIPHEHTHTHTHTCRDSRNRSSSNSSSNSSSSTARPPKDDKLSQLTMTSVIGAVDPLSPVEGKLKLTRCIFLLVASQNRRDRGVPVAGRVPEQERPCDHRTGPPGRGVHVHDHDPGEEEPAAARLGDPRGGERGGVRVRVGACVGGVGPGGCDGQRAGRRLHRPAQAVHAADHEVLHPRPIDERPLYGDWLAGRDHHGHEGRHHALHAGHAVSAVARAAGRGGVGALQRRVCVGRADREHADGPERALPCAARGDPTVLREGPERVGRGADGSRQRVRLPVEDDHQERGCRAAGPGAAHPLLVAAAAEGHGGVVARAALHDEPHPEQQRRGDAEHRHDPAALCTRARRRRGQPGSAAARPGVRLCEPAQHADPRQGAGCRSAAVPRVRWLVGGLRPRSSNTFALFSLIPLRRVCGKVRRQLDSQTAEDSRTARRHFHRARARCAALCWRRSGEAVRACVHVRVGGSGPKISRQQTAHLDLASRLKERARTPPPPAWLAKGATATAQPERERDAHRLRLAERAARTTDRQHFRRVALHFTRAAEDQPVAARSNALSPLLLALSSSSPECPLLPASLRPCASSL
ncbi:hypothetical protein L1887_53981 [Cichorium endivia]|nr:hypothetical protein L1887_53981 [Cichorium endivia]